MAAAVPSRRKPLNADPLGSKVFSMRGTRCGLVILLLATGTCGILYFPTTFDLGLPFGYYGKVNRILARIADCSHLEVISVARHKDLTLEDFWITVRDRDGVETDLAFPNANMRSVSDLAVELQRVGCE